MHHRALASRTPGFVVYDQINPTSWASPAGRGRRALRGTCQSGIMIAVRLMNWPESQLTKKAIGRDEFSRRPPPVRTAGRKGIYRLRDSNWFQSISISSSRLFLEGLPSGGTVLTLGTLDLAWSLDDVIQDASISCPSVKARSPVCPKVSRVASSINIPSAINAVSSRLRQSPDPPSMVACE